MAGGGDLRATMQRHPAGVSVVTVDLEGEKVGLTIASLLSVALEPPLVGISIAKNAAMHELLRGAGGFAISILGADQQAVAQHFARGVPPIAMWEGIPVRESPRGPLLEGALGWIESELQAELDAGDHTFFLGAVERAEPGVEGPPLVRLGGEYRPA